PAWPTFLYNYYNLDPNWHANEIGNRILLLDPLFFTAYPVSEKCIEFMLALAQNIPNIQVYVGSFNSLRVQTQSSTLYFKEHPLHSDYIGIEESRDWIVPEIDGYYPSFFSYWKKIEKLLTSKPLGK
ncbi:MAG: FAD-binding domain-containing protein, partial [Bacteroidia bacterium]